MKDLRAEADDPEPFEALATDPSRALLSDRQRAIVDYSIKLTVEPAAVGAADVELLRGAGLDDLAITDVAQVAAYFNYINRIADGLGVDHEDFMREGN